MRAAEETASAIRGTISAICRPVGRELKGDSKLQEAVEARKKVNATISTARKPYVEKMDKLVATLAGQTLTDPKTHQPITVAVLRTWVSAANDKFAESKEQLYAQLPPSKGLTA